MTKSGSALSYRNCVPLVQERESSSENQTCPAMTVVNFSLSFTAESDFRMPVNNACWDMSRAALCRRTDRSGHRAAHFLSRLPFPGPKRPPVNQNPHNAKAATLMKKAFNWELKLEPDKNAPFAFTYYSA